MNLEDLPPVEVMWEGRFVRALAARQMGICEPRQGYSRGGHPC